VSLRQGIRQLNQHRRALEVGADPVVVTGWITETEIERGRLEASRQQLTATVQTGLTRAEIQEMVTGRGDLITVFRKWRLRSTAASAFASTRPQRQPEP
jgi:hypothetical protein